MTDDLIERLEKVTGPDRELDGAIYEAVVGFQMYESIYKHNDGAWCVRYYPGPPGPVYKTLPRYTGSLDAALTLVPEDLAVHEMGHSHPDRRGWYACILTKKRDCTGWNAIPAIAVCIAAIKARSVSQNC